MDFFRSKKYFLTSRIQADKSFQQKEKSYSFFWYMRNYIQLVETFGNQSAITTI